MAGELGVGLDDGEGVLAGGGSMTSSCSRMWRNSSWVRRPCWAAPRMSPSRRCERSRRASSKPSVVAATAASRVSAGSASVPVTRRQSPGRPPRPIRPRSWCSWETPNRSASMTTMTLAFGTSTPDLDDGRRDEDVGLAPLEARHDGVLVLGGHPPVQHLDGEAGERRLLGERGVHGIDALERSRRCGRPVVAVVGRLARGDDRALVGGVVVADPGADDVGLAARARPPRPPAPRCAPSSPAGPRGRRGW